jgi:glycosyltransferase involved in cell wall biosynthesis
MNNPLISVITVVYNGAATLEQTMLSVINQTYKNIEYIIIDGGSTDGTVDIIKKYEKHLSCWISEPDNGIYYAMNNGLSKATGEFVYFLNAGDSLFEKTTLSKIVAKMSNLYCIYYGDAYMTNIRKLYWGKFSRFKLAVGNICHQSVFYPKNVYQTNKYITKYILYADYCYNISLYQKIDFIYLNETISIYDYSGISKSHKDSDIEFRKNVHWLIVKNLGLLPFIYRLIYRGLVLVKKCIFNAFNYK